MKFDAPVVGNHEARERAQKRLNALREVGFFWLGDCFRYGDMGAFSNVLVVKDL